MKVNDDAVEEPLAWGITPHDLPCYGVSTVRQGAAHSKHMIGALG